MSLIIQEKKHPQPLSANLEVLSDLAYASVTHSSGFNYFLEALQQTFSCTTATLSIRNTSTGQVMGGWYQDMPHVVIEYYIANLGHRDPLLKRAIEQEKNGFCSAFYSNDNHLDDPVVQGWCEQAGLADGACAVIHKDAHSIFALTLGRSSDQGHFQQQELQQLSLLIRDIRRAIALRLAFDQTKSTSLLQSIFDHLTLPLLFIKQGGYLSFRNKKAQDWLDHSSVLTINNSGIAELSDHKNNARLLAYSSAILDKNDTDSKVLSVKSGDEGASLLLTPIRSEKESDMGILVTIYPWNKEHGISPDRIKKFFNLSKAESQVCDYLCRGVALEDIAAETCRGLSTIRSHLKSIYQKTATNRQAELVSHVLTTLMRNEYC